ncbi:MAG: alanine racemase [Verrucomicrobiae bacterium]|nr:alanine racemase [Verrucomicrobiae bacterium]
MKKAPPLRAWAEIHRARLAFNLQEIRRRIGPDRKLIGVVKADAYGHGLTQTAQWLSELGVDFFGVAGLPEAVECQRATSKAPVLLLSGALPDEAEEIVARGIRPTLSIWEEAQAFIRVARKLRRQVHVHLKVDTGMGRLGAWHEQACDFALRLAAVKEFELEGIYTHLATADSNQGFAVTQLKRLTKVIDTLASRGLRFPIRHYSNSAATLTMSLGGFNYVRPGLAVYGISPIPGPTLKPILDFKSRLTVIKTIEKGRPLSYDSVFRATRRMRVGTVCAGYADGYKRHLTNRSEVIVHGRRCRQLGRVTMDEIIVDLSRVPQARWGDPVTFIGRDGREEVTTVELAKLANTIPWEILTGLGKRTVRVYKE